MKTPRQEPHSSQSCRIPRQHRRDDTVTQPARSRLMPIVTAVIIALLALLIRQTALSDAAQLTLIITLITAVFWITEWLPIPVASLIPLALFPLLGVLTPTQVAAAYGSPLILLLLGGFLLSTAMAHSNTHILIAQRIIRAVGGHSPTRLLISFMITAALLSMWISNTATTLMLVPIAMAVIQSSTSENGEISVSLQRQFAIVLLLGIAYAASLGGINTPIGTPPNLLMLQNYQQGTGEEIGFLSWMSKTMPMTLIFLPIMMWLLSRSLPKVDVGYDLSQDAPNSMQRRILIVFVITALAWMTRTEPFGGWRGWLDLPTANDASVAMLAVVAMFLIPAGRDRPGERLLTWETANKIPWGILLLFAGGITIASAFQQSGLSETVAGHLVVLQQLPVWLIILTVCLSVTFLTEITSNTATTAILMPILLSTAQAMEVDPLLLMLPATISASFAFMMPVATAPNAIVFGSGQIHIREMMRYGFKLNLIGAVVVTALSVLLL